MKQKFGSKNRGIQYPEDLKIEPNSRILDLQDLATKQMFKVVTRSTGSRNKIPRQSHGPQDLTSKIIKYKMQNFMKIVPDPGSAILINSMF